MSDQVRTVVHCPLCGRIYRQVVAREWRGKTRRVRNDETSLRALCEENGQDNDGRLWVGVAYCKHCSLTRVPPVLRDVLEKWLREGEET